MKAGEPVNKALMPSRHRWIPVLPESPRVHPISGGICRSYPVGRQSFSRACQRESLALTITTEDRLANQPGKAPRPAGGRRLFGLNVTKNKSCLVRLTITNDLGQEFSGEQSISVLGPP